MRLPVNVFSGGVVYQQPDRKLVRVQRSGSMKYTEPVRAWVLLVYSQDSRRIILEHSLV